MSPISVRGFAVASATAVTAVGSVVGVASGSTTQNLDDAETTAADSTLLADIPAGQQAQVETATSLTQQADFQAIAADASAKKDAEEAARKAAAKIAIEKKELAEKAAQAAKERAEAEAKAKAARNSSFPVQSSYSIAQIQSMARQVVSSGQFQCFSNIVDHESSWNYRAVNASSGAYGLFQALPASKYTSAGSDWRTNPGTQIKWGLNYMNSRYGSPCEAWSFWQANNWY
ncbi:transglycosylase SLT domain-containing protein [Streptomyces sp. NPDC050619]|uniref:aggregation-promoting factor C-terminal-like domain-containing protein n=1 Tax=Streptomyces sp. NPDC050619 TaxID=3157214 RepID=UPI00343DD5C8